MGTVDPLSILILIAVMLSHWLLPLGLLAVTVAGLLWRSRHTAWASVVLVALVSSVVQLQRVYRAVVVAGVELRGLRVPEAFALARDVLAGQLVPAFVVLTLLASGLAWRVGGTRFGWLVAFPFAIALATASALALVPFIGMLELE